MIMRAVLWMSGTLTSFCLMAIGARELSGELSIFQTLLVRSLVGLLCILLIIIFSRKQHQIKTEKLGLHTLRNIFHFAGQYGWFLGIGLLPLAEVFALEFTVPIWTLILAAIFLQEQVTLRKFITVVLGMIGVLVIVKPGYAIVDFASIIVLVSSIFYAISHTITKSLSSSDSALSILFYMCIIQLPIGLLFTVGKWVNPTVEQWLWLLIIGVTAMSAHFCMVKAMMYTEVTMITTMDFLRLPLIALVGVLIYAESFEASLIVGGAIMLLGNLVSLNLPRKRAHSKQCN